MGDKQIRVEVVYALPKEQRVVELYVPEGTTVLQAAEMSGLDKHYPEIDLATASLGVFSKLSKTPAEQPLRENDRVEIYRALIADPKQARLKRAAKQQAQ